MRITVFAFILAAAPAAAAAAQTSPFDGKLPFEGKWAHSTDGCGKSAPAHPGLSDIEITLTAKRLVAAPAVSCDFTSVLPGGMSFRVEASCVAVGKRSSEFFTFAVLDGRLYWSWADKTQTLARCRD